MPFKDSSARRAWERAYRRKARTKSEPSVAEPAADPPSTPPGRPPHLPEDVRARGPAEVAAWLWHHADAVDAHEVADPLERARVAGQLAPQILRAYEVAEIAPRLEAIEQVLKTRRKPN